MNSNFINVHIKNLIFAFSFLFLSTTLSAAPNNGDVINGSANINQSGGNTTINQNSDKAIINWDSFDIGATESVHFNQLGANSVVLNRVIGGGRTEIMGKLSANGNVFLLNSNGILVGNGASINVGSFMASTGTMTDNDFLTGRYNINNAMGEIINQGSITVNNYGFAALLSKRVINEGLISANLGRIDISAGESFRLNFYDNNLIGIDIDKGTAEAYIKNSGIIDANGGTIYISAKGISSLLSATVNNEGIIRADSISSNGGKIYISAVNGTVNNSGTISAESKNIGGVVNITGGIVNHSGRIVASGDVRGGIIFIDSTESTHLTSISTAYVDSITGKAGDIQILSNGTTYFDKGSILSAKSTHGNGGFIEVSSKQDIYYNGKVDLKSIYGKSGQFLLDPETLWIVNKKNPGDKNTLAVEDIEANGTYSATNIIFDGTILDTRTGETLTYIATQDIIFQGGYKIEAGTLNLVAGRDISILGTGKITLTNELNVILKSSGNFTSEATAEIKVPHLSVSTYSGNVNLQNITGENATASLTLTTNVLNIPGMEQFGVGGDLIINNETTTGAVALDGITVGGLLKLTTKNADISTLTNTLKANSFVATAKTINLGTSQLNFISAEATGTINITNDNIGNVTITKMKTDTTGSVTYNQLNGALAFFDAGTEPNGFENFSTDPAGPTIINRSGSIKFPIFAVAKQTGDNIDGINGLFTATLATFYDYIPGRYTTVIINKDYFTSAVANQLVIDVPANIQLTDIALPQKSLSVISQTGTITSTGTAGADLIKLDALRLEAKSHIDLKYGGPFITTGEFSGILSLSSQQGDINLEVPTTPTQAPFIINKLVSSAGGTVTIDTRFSTFGLTISGIAVKGQLKIDHFAGQPLTLIGGIDDLTTNPDNLYDMNLDIVKTPSILDIANTKGVTLAGASLSGTGTGRKSVVVKSLTGNIRIENNFLDAEDKISLTGSTLNYIAGIPTPIPITLTTPKLYLNFSNGANVNFNPTADDAMIDINGNNISVEFNRDTRIADIDSDGFAMTGGTLTLNAKKGNLTFLNAATVNNLTITTATGNVMLRPPQENINNENMFSNTVWNIGTLNIISASSIYARNDSANLSRNPVINANYLTFTVADYVYGAVADKVTELPAGNLSDQTEALYLTLNVKYDALIISNSNARDKNLIYINPSSSFITAIRRYQFAIQNSATPNVWFLDTSKNQAKLVDVNYYTIFNAVKNQYFYPMGDVTDFLNLEASAYENLLQLGGEMITSDIRYPRYVTALYKINKKTEIK